MRDFDRRGPEDMTGGVESKREVTDLFVLAEGQRAKLFEGFLGVLAGIERQCWLVFRESFAIRVQRIFFLNVRRVRQQDLAELCRRSCRVDGASKSFSHEARKQSAVVDMGMGEKDGIDRSWVDGQRSPVANSKRLDPLIQAAIDQDAGFVGFEQVFRSGHGSGRAEERDLHADSQEFVPTAMVSHAATDVPVVGHRSGPDCGRF